MSEVRLVSSMEGPDDAPVLILANPIGTTRAIWDAQARVLREDYRLLRFELRGHGGPGAQSDGRHRGLQAPGDPGHLAPGSLSDPRSRHRRHPGSPSRIVG